MTTFTNWSYVVALTCTPKSSYFVGQSMRDGAADASIRGIETAASGSVMVLIPFMMVAVAG
jgi:hypothetical protein